jgi:16S rRNA processing protein RimM
LSEPDPELDLQKAVTVGRIVAAHGLRGDVKVQPFTDFPERFDRGARLWLDGAPRRVEQSRWQGGSVFLRFEGVSSRTQAEELRGKELMLPEAEPIAEEGRYYLHDIVGLRVEDPAGETLGRVADVLSTGSNDVYVVRGERGELLLPAVDDVVKTIDVPGGRIVAELLEGLEFRQTAPRLRSRRPSPTSRNRRE